MAGKRETTEHEFKKKLFELTRNSNSHNDLINVSILNKSAIRLKLCNAEENRIDHRD